MDVKLERINKDTAGEKALPESFDGYFFKEAHLSCLIILHFKTKTEISPKAILFLNLNHKLTSNQDVVLEYYCESS